MAFPIENVHRPLQQCVLCVRRLGVSQLLIIVVFSVLFSESGGGKLKLMWQCGLRPIYH